MNIEQLKQQVRWSGEDAFIVGGGSSLRDYDFSKLIGRNVIGVNEAFRLGPHVIKVNFFGDAGWFHRSKWDLEASGIPAVTNSPGLQAIRAPWLVVLARQNDGLSLDPARLGWNHSSGAAAINLAILLGAKRIFLLGFDLAPGTDGRTTHWHSSYAKTTPQASFLRFLQGFKRLGDVLKGLTAVEVYTVTDGGSKLEAFPRITFEEMETMVAGRKPAIKPKEKKGRGSRK